MKSEKQLFDEEYAEELKHNPGMAPEDFAQKYGLDLPTEYRSGNEQATLPTMSSVSGNKMQIGEASIKNPYLFPYINAGIGLRREEKPDQESEISREEQMANRETEDPYHKNSDAQYDTMNNIAKQMYLKSQQEKNSWNAINNNYAEKENSYLQSRQKRREDVDYRVSQGHMYDETLPDLIMDQVKKAEPYFNEDFKEEIRKNFGTYENMLRNYFAEDPQVQEAARYYTSSVFDIAKNTNMLINYINTFRNSHPALNVLYNAINPLAPLSISVKELMRSPQSDMGPISSTAAAIGFLTPDTADYRSHFKGWTQNGYRKATDLSYDEIRRRSHPKIHDTGKATGDIGMMAGTIVADRYGGGGAGAVLNASDSGLSHLNAYLQDKKTGSEALNDTTYDLMIDILSAGVGSTVKGAANGMRLLPVEQGKNIIRDMMVDASFGIAGDEWKKRPNPIPQVIEAVKEAADMQIPEETLREMVGVLAEETNRLTSNPEFQALDKWTQQSLLEKVKDRVSRQFQIYVYTRP